MGDVAEFHYRLPVRAGGMCPGAHRGTGLGAGQEFAAHMRLLDNPDPRRLDLRASLRNMRQEWLVRVHRQRAAVTVHAVVDVSASMHFGAGDSKLAVAADFVAALGQGAFRAGDPVGLLAFDATERTDLYVPARHARGAGEAMAAALRGCVPRVEGAGEAIAAALRGRVPRMEGGREAITTVLRGRVPHGEEAGGLARTVERLAGRRGLVFLLSDFHWPLDMLPPVLDQLAQAFVVPVVLWDPAETAPPEDNGLLAVRDAETGRRRVLWMRPRMRQAWLEAVARRRTELADCFATRGLRPLYLHGAFDAEAVSRYFLEAVA